MIVHNVFFWLKKDLIDDDVKSFEKGLLDLGKLDSVKQIFVGRPAPTARPVVDSSYSYCLTVIFENMIGHDDYQVDPLHKAFLSNHSAKWERVLIYDSIE